MTPFLHPHSPLLSVAAGHTQGTNSPWKLPSVCGHPKLHTHLHHLGNLKIGPNVALSLICPAKVRKLPLKGQMINIIVPTSWVLVIKKDSGRMDLSGLCAWHSSFWANSLGNSKMFHF